MEREAWPSLRKKLEAIFKTKTRDEWCKIMEGTDVCFAPVLTVSEAPQHPHMVARKTFVQRHGVTQPAPAPRFSRTPSTVREPAAADIASLVGDWRREKAPSR
jgi:alpha-methylacyl-CoA racemase